MQELLRKVKGDKVIWTVVIILSLISLLAVYSATDSLAWRNNKSSGFFLVKQLSILAMGLVFIFIVHQINYTRFAKFAVILYLLSIPLLLYTLIFGTSLNDGARWITLPFVNLTFQASDLARLALFLFLARQLSVKQKEIKDFRKGFLPILFPIIAICGLIAPANLSTALLLGITCSILLFIGRVSIKHLALLVALGLAVILLIFLVSKTMNVGRGSTWQNRIETFMGQGEQKESFQTEQANIAIASGQLFGRGPGNSWARDFLPHPYSDFIFAIIIEEYGFVGGALLVGIYLIFLWRSILIFRRIPFAFGAFLAVGLSFTLVFQAMVNMMVNVHLLPVTGLTLPLVSMGGSSIWFNSIAIGVILSVSRYVDEMEGKGKSIAAVID